MVLRLKSSPTRKLRFFFDDIIFPAQDRQASMLTIGKLQKVMRPEAGRAAFIDPHDAESRATLPGIELEPLGQEKQLDKDLAQFMEEAGRGVRGFCRGTASLRVAALQGRLLSKIQHKTFHAGEHLRHHFGAGAYKSTMATAWGPAQKEFDKMMRDGLCLPEHCSGAAMRVLARAPPLWIIHAEIRTAVLARHCAKGSGGVKEESRIGDDFTPMDAATSQFIQRARIARLDHTPSVLPSNVTIHLDQVKAEDREDDGDGTTLVLGTDANRHKEVHDWAAEDEQAEHDDLGEEVEMGREAIEGVAGEGPHDQNNTAVGGAVDQNNAPQAHQEADPLILGAQPPSVMPEDRASADVPAAQLSKKNQKFRKLEEREGIRVHSWDQFC